MKQKKRNGILLVALAIIVLLSGCGKSQQEEAREAETIQQEATLSEDVAPEEDTSNNDNTLTLIMVGDVLLHDPVEDAARDAEGNYNFDFLFEETKDEIASADIAIANQEVMIGGEELGVSGYPAFNAPYEIGDALTNAGFDVICHGTNHALDKGGAGIQNALAYWKEHHPKMVIAGINASKEEQNAIDIVEAKGMRIAILNYTYGTNGIPLPSDMPYAVNLLEEQQVISDLEAAEAQADFTVVCPHWGIEYRLEETAEQQRWAKLMVEHGADLIIGTHPHVIEPYEEVDGVPVYYSLGNFINWTSDSGSGIANRMVGGMAEVTLCREADGTISVSDYGMKALVCHLSPGEKGVVAYPLTDYNETLAETNAIRNQDSSFSYSYCEDLCNQVWGEGRWE
jgi:poly-gamma-glutamate synthesis protein (capsule biosynthesis protein)